MKKHTIRCLTPHVRSLQMAVVAKHDSLLGIFTLGTEPDGVPPCIWHKTVERRLRKCHEPSLLWLFWPLCLLSTVDFGKSANGVTWWLLLSLLLSMMIINDLWFYFIMIMIIKMASWHESSWHQDQQLGGSCPPALSSLIIGHPWGLPSGWGWGWEWGLWERGK